MLDDVAEGEGTVVEACAAAPGIEKLIRAIQGAPEAPCYFRKHRCQYFWRCANEGMACEIYEHYALERWNIPGSIYALYHPHGRIPSRRVWERIFTQSDENPRAPRDDRGVELSPRIPGKPGRKPKEKAA